MPPVKAEFHEYLSSCTPLLKLPEFEAAMRRRVCEVAGRLVGFDYDADPINGLIAFMREDLDLFKVLLNLTSLSQEKFRRVLASDRHARGDYGSEWAISQIHRRIRRDDDFARVIADMLLEGRENKVLAEYVPDFYLDQLGLPDRWADMLQDPDFASRIARGMLAGEYSDKKGDEVERIVSDRLDQALAPLEMPSIKGRVPFLGKEVDLAVPNLDFPNIMIMVTYMETTGSGQTQRANEQDAMFDAVETWNSRNNTNKAFINVVDGGGWLSRRKDLTRLYNKSHYCLSLNMLDQLDEIVAHHA